MPALPRMMPGGREIGAGHDLHHFIDGDVGVVHHRQRRVDHLAQIVAGDVGRHAHGDTAAAIDQQIGEARRQDRRFALGIVVVVAEIDGVLVEIVQKRSGDLFHAHFGVTHGGGHIAVDRAEIALPIDQRHAHGKVLRHAHQRHDRPQRRRAGGIYRSRHRRHAPICGRACCARSPARASKTGCAGAPA